MPCLLLCVWDDLGILPEALRTKCARCSPQQLEGGLRVITKLYYDYPAQYARLRGKWDPTGEYHRRFEEYLRGLQFNTINNDPVSRKWFCDGIITSSHLNSNCLCIFLYLSLSTFCVAIAQPNTATTPQKTAPGSSFVASASSNNQNVIPTALPAATVRFYFLNLKKHKSCQKHVFTHNPNIFLYTIFDFYENQF